MKTYSPLTKPSLLAVNTAARNVRGLTHHNDTELENKIDNDNV